MNNRKLPNVIFSCILALTLLSLCCLPACAAAAAMVPGGQPEVVSIDDGGGGHFTTEDRGNALPDDVRPEEVPGQVAGASDEAPDGMSIFWGIVVSLLVAGAVVVGIVLLMPKEEA